MFLVTYSTGALCSGDAIGGFTQCNIIPIEAANMTLIAIVVLLAILTIWIVGVIGLCGWLEIAKLLKKVEKV